MSDPGITYRTKDEINEYRSKHDPILFVKHVLLDHKLASEDELKVRIF
jgi:pyruvate dehydrogenase E1 component alpha subunit